MDSLNIQIIPSLGSAPSRLFPQWKLSVTDITESLYVDIYPEGLGVAFTDNEWNLIHPPIAGVPIPRPIPADPGLQANGANA
jgi:hypothetical protein